MSQIERTPTGYALQSAASSTAGSVALRSAALPGGGGKPFDFTFEAVRPGIFRTTFSSADHPLPPAPSAPRLTPVFPADASPSTTVDTVARKATIQTGEATATVEWAEGGPVVTVYRSNVAEPVYRDLPYRSYTADGAGIAHYSQHRKDDLYMGLGEKAAPMNLANRFFRITASDTFGYDAYRTDPLYKHIPLLLHIRPDAVVGLFSTTHGRATWAVGSEIDGMWGSFQVYRQAVGGLELYVLVGASTAAVVRRYAEIVGFPLLVPRYMTGYVGGGMKYSMTDSPRGADNVVAFLDQCRQHDMPISAFQMSSGYTVAETEPKTRNVFTWNRHRFPDPAAFAAACHARGVRLLANIKPYVLASHPAYGALVQGGALFRDPDTGGHGVARLWSAGGGESGEGSHLDFTSAAGARWWYDGCRSLRQVGLDGMWNDNNEYNVFRDDWECALEVGVKTAEKASSKSLAAWGRALHTELMAKASHDACVAEAPHERPLVLTRSATAGTMRYACASWSGDNVTSWAGMRGANALSMQAGVSLLACYGHDVGGFEGPQPTPALLVRWVQLAIHQPRFAINCYKTSPTDNLVGDVIEPWMYPEATDLVRAALRRRYALIPYTYGLLLAAHRTAQPPLRWTGWGCEADPEVWTPALRDNGEGQFWYGDALLVAGVYDEASDAAQVYLPASGDGPAAGDKDGDGDGEAINTSFGFLNVHAPHQWLPAGRWHRIYAPWQLSVPVLARCGAAVPVGRIVPTTSRAHPVHDAAMLPSLARDDWRGIEIFPPPTLRHPEPATFASSWLEDDGISPAGQCPIYRLAISYATDGDKPLRVSVSAAVDVPAEPGAAAWQPLWLASGIDVILPVGEERAVEGATQKPLDETGRRVWHMSVSSAE